jgi:ketosteroid isomerase-like protein
MSENLDLVRSIYAAWERGDFSSTDWADPEIEYASPDAITPGTTTGVAGMAKGFGGFLSAWDGYRVEADEYRELDEDRIFVPMRFVGRGKTSGLELAQMQVKGAHLFHVQHAKVTKLVNYANRDRAFTDLGLEG